MGRPFASELANLPENLAFALEYPVTELADAIDRAKTGRIMACGAGGSFSAASFAQLLFLADKTETQAITPLGFLQKERPLEPTTLILFTAGGRNKDILRVIEHACERSVSLLLVCATTGSPAATLTRRVHTNRVFEFDYPAKRDGFLAVNSLATTWWLLARAFGVPPPAAGMAKEVCDIPFDLSHISPDRRHACLVLHDQWTRPVAVDLESKMAEAALCAPLVSDWRQFGHGRHHWLAKNGAHSSVLSLDAPEAHALADRTLRLLPKSQPQTRLKTALPGIPGVCHLLLQSFAFVGALGRRVGIDPGRPGVPPFGSNLYHLAPVRSRPTRIVKGWDVQLAAERKTDAIGIRSSRSAANAIILAAARQYSERLSRQRFGAVVLDFDGTAAASGLLPDMPLTAEVAEALVRLLRKRIVIGIATGRGDSCHQNLATAVPESLWRRVFVCHYNGASIGNLAELMSKPIGWPNDPLLVEIVAELGADPMVTALAEIKLKGPQITIRAKSRSDAPVVEQLVRTHLAHRHSQSARIVASSHTLDIVPMAATKIALVEHIRKHQLPEGEVLTIGDRGDLFGNDFDLLSTAHSLSVDRVSTALDSCWNFLPRGVSHQTGTALYLERVRMKEGLFQLHPT